MLINKIWNLLNNKQKKIFFSLAIFNLVILVLEVASLSAVFPIIHSLNNEQNFFDKFDKLQHLKDDDEAELLGWDAEKYRKLIKR